MDSATFQSFSASIFRSSPKPKNPIPHTYKEEQETFSQIEQKEKDLYAIILSFEPLHDFLLNQLKTCVTKDDSKESKLIISSGKIHSEKLLLPVLRLCDAARDWTKYVVKLLSDPINFPFDDEQDGRLISTIYDLQTDESYKIWSQQVLRKCQEVADLKSKYAARHFGLVNNIVKSKFGSKKLPFEDMQQEGYFGLVRAVDKFDYTKGWRFSTYALYWITHFIQRFLEDRNYLIRSPVHTYKKRAKVKKLIKKFEGDNGREPTHEEIKKLAGMRSSSLKLLLETFKFTRLDSPINFEDGKACLHERIPDDEAISSFDAKANDEVKNLIHQALKTLTPIERHIILNRFGFINDQELMLQELGNHYKLSRERIRQIQSQALLKLKQTISESDCV